MILRYVRDGAMSPYEVWRRLYFTTEELNNQSISGDNADADHDGMSNLNEYRCGTRPNDGTSCLGFTALDSCPPVSGGFVVSWQSASNKQYTLQAATNLMKGFGLILGTNIAATPPENVHTDSVGTAEQRFYRVTVE